MAQVPNYVRALNILVPTVLLAKADETTDNERERPFVVK